MKAVLACSLILAAILLVAGPALAQDKEGKQKSEDKKPKVSPETMLEAMRYFPMEKDNSWEYKTYMGFGDPDGNPVHMSESQDMTQKVTKVTEEGCEMEVQGGAFGVAGTEKVFVKGGYLHLSLSFIGSAVRALKLPPVKGEKWKTETQSPWGAANKLIVSHTVSAIENINTPAGKFRDAVRVVSYYDTPGGGPGNEETRITMTTWFAPGVGIVKSVTAWPFGTIEQTLAKYKVAKGGKRELALALEVCDTAVVASLKVPSEDNLDKEGLKKLRREMKELRAARKKKWQKGEAVQVTLVVEKVLKGKLQHKEIAVSTRREMGNGKWVVFLGKLKKEGYPVIGNVYGADKTFLERIDALQNPPKPKTLAEKLADAELVVVAKPVVREDRGEFCYWVLKVESTLKGKTSREHVDVLLDKEIVLEESKQYILMLRQGKYFGRRFFKPLEKKPVEYSKEKQEEYQKALKKE